MKTFNLIKSVVSTEIVLSIFLFAFFIFVGVSFFMIPVNSVNIMLGFFFLMVSVIIALVSFDLIRDNYRNINNL